MVRMTCELETNIVAVERIKEYTETKTEVCLPECLLCLPTSLLACLLALAFPVQLICRNKLFQTFSQTHITFIMILLNVKKTT